jgi:SAM-dependent methyltransferase
MLPAKGVGGSFVLDVVSWIDRTLYAEYTNNWDDYIFRNEIVKVLKQDYHILDLGAGAGRVAQMNFRGLVTHICGIDPDSRVEANPYLDEAKVAFGEDIPYSDTSFDVVFADNVLEHLQNPVMVFQEVTRVLKPGGLFLVKTPNKMHYMPLMARLTPYKLHKFINQLRGRDIIDTFPTLYKVNTPSEISYYAACAGLYVPQVLLFEGRPEYLRFTALSYLLGWLYERCVNVVPGLYRFRILLIAILEKPLRSSLYAE